MNQVWFTSRFSLTSGNILEIYKSKKIKNVVALLSVDKKTGWLWILSLVGITAFPPSVLFISEFLMVKTMFEAKHFVMSIVFLLLLTIVLFGLAKAVISMSYGETTEEKKQELLEHVKKIPVSMYLPQIVLLLVAFILGIYLPSGVKELIDLTVLGL